MDIYKCPISFFQSTLGILLCKLYNKWPKQLKENHRFYPSPRIYTPSVNTSPRKPSPVKPSPRKTISLKNHLLEKPSPRKYIINVKHYLKTQKESNPTIMQFVTSLFNKIKG